jgi:hypothetical protein
MAIEMPTESPSTETKEPLGADKHRRNVLAELAAFVEQRTTIATVDPVISEISLDEFKQRMQDAEAFFEKISSGAFASLGLVIRH